MSCEELSTVNALIDLCTQLKVTCVVQVGAEDGYEAYKLKQATGCRAIAIDPDPSCAPISTKIEYHEVLIGSKDKVSNFYWNRIPGLSSPIRRGDAREIKLNLPQSRLDTFCTRFSIEPDALIIDTEGTTLDVLEGCGDLLDNVKLIYAECQTVVLRPGMRLVSEVDAFLTARGFVQHAGLPAYSVEGQGNYTWIRP